MHNLYDICPQAEESSVLSTEHDGKFGYKQAVSFPVKIKEGSLKDTVETEDQEKVQLLNYTLYWV